MDESLLELENELKRLRPRMPSAQVLRRIEAGLAAPETPSENSRSPDSPVLTMWPWLNWRTAAAAAAVVAFATVIIYSRFRVSAGGDLTETVPQSMAAVEATVPTTSSTVQETSTVFPAPANDRYQPVGAASVLYDLKEDRVVTLPDSTPARRLRYRYVDTYTWKNPVTNASLKWSLPRDEVRVLPASLH